MINRFLELFNDVCLSPKKGTFLADKSYKYDTVFYLSNFIVPIIFAVYSVVVAILLLPNIISFSSSYTEYINAIDMNKVPSYVSMMWLPDTSFVIVIGILPIVLLLAASVSNIIIAVKKYLKQKRENELVKEAE